MHGNRLRDPRHTHRQHTHTDSQTPRHMQTHRGEKAAQRCQGQEVGIELVCVCVCAFAVITRALSWKSRPWSPSPGSQAASVLCGPLCWAARPSKYVLRPLLGTSTVHVSVHDTGTRQPSCGHRQHSLAGATVATSPRVCTLIAGPTHRQATSPSHSVCNHCPAPMFVH